jgi:glycosyltransferase involved in cell wall biosynthesis/predicted SAM-dependent methyltransferase
MKKLNLGCGPKIIQNWENLDIEPGPGGITCDLRGKLPYEDSSVSYIYSEHFIEHLTKDDLTKLLKECYRVLQPGGVIRLITPDLRVIARDYLGNRYDRYHEVGHYPMSACDFINESMHNWGHTYLYDFNELEMITREVGFYQILRGDHQKSKHKNLENLETRAYVSDLIIEATKPATKSYPLVSVIMPSYNHASFIKESIESVLNQSLTDFELCITDDFSTDSSVEIIESFKDSRIKLIKLEKNMGAAFAMNTSLRNSLGKYISIINSDDIFEPFKLEKQVNFLANNPEISAVFTHVQFINENNENIQEQDAKLGNFSQENYSRQDWLTKLILFGNCLAHPTVMIRSEVFNKIGHYDERFRQLPDYDMWIRILQAKNIYVLPERLIRFRKLSNEMNESSPRPEVIQRYNWERLFIFEKLYHLAEGDFLHLCKVAIPEIDVDICKHLPREQVMHLIGIKFNNMNLIDCALHLTFRSFPRLGEGGGHQNLRYPSELASTISYRG